MNDVALVVRQAILKQTIIRVLSSPATQRINFFIGFLHITGAGYRRVVSALNDGSITVKIGKPSEGAAAEFHSNEDYYLFPDRPYGFAPVDLLNIVHESTHAIIAHAQASPAVADTSNEAAAYVAGALWNLYAGSPIPRKSFVTAPLVVEANIIADRIKNPPGGLVSAEELARLRAFIAIHPTYYNLGVNYFSHVYKSRS
jgi:hypothetical protein